MDDNSPGSGQPIKVEVKTRSAGTRRAAVIGILLGLACGAQALILLISLYTGDVFNSAPLRMMCLSEPVMAAGSLICAAIVLHPFLTEGFRPGIAAARRSGYAIWLALTGLVVSVISTVLLAFMFIIAMGLE